MTKQELIKEQERLKILKDFMFEIENALGFGRMCEKDDKIIHDWCNSKRKEMKKRIEEIFFEL